MREQLRRLGLNLFAVVVALIFAGAVTSIILAARGDSPTFVVSQMWHFGTTADTEVNILNRSTYLYLSAVAVAIGFRMNLFNIGVDGQYQLAACVAAAFGGSVALPNGLRQLAIVIVAMLVGAGWAGIVAVLKVTRGVSEVISTIMLNFVATGLIAFLMRPSIFGVQLNGNDRTTKPIPGSGQVRGIDLISGSTTKVYSLIFLAVVVGVVFQLVISRTRFGFDLRATGRSLPAAQASGVNVKRMTVIALLASGALAGLVGMPILLGDSHAYSASTFPSGFGFAGIAIALLGRNNPLGIAFATLLWSFLDESSLILDINGIPKEIVQITQGIVVLSVVVAYEVVRRLALRSEQRRVGRALTSSPPSAGTPAVSEATS